MLTPTRCADFGGGDSTVVHTRLQQCLKLLMETTSSLKSLITHFKIEEKPHGTAQLWACWFLLSLRDLTLSCNTVTWFIPFDLTSWMTFRILSVPARRRTRAGLRHHWSNSLYAKTYLMPYYLTHISYMQEALNHPAHRCKRLTACFWAMCICLQIQVLQVRSDTSG